MSSAMPVEALPGQHPDYEFAVEASSQWALARRRFLRHRLAVISLVVFVFVVTAGLLARQLAPYEYGHIDVHALSSAPSWAHPFGTDSVGQDYFSRVLVGLGVEVRIALLVGVFGTLIGMLVGATTGYFGGLFDNVVMRGVDVLLTMPPLVVLLVGASYLHATTVLKVSILIACVVWMPVARVVRASCLSLREKEYIEAARAVGASDLRIIVRHLLPNAGGTVAVAASVMTAGAVILETTLAFLGFGVTNYLTGASRRSLGEVMLLANGDGLFNWWGLFFPGFAVVLLVAPMYFIGDGLRDALDPTERRYARPRRKRKPSRLGAKIAASSPFPDLAIAELAGRLSPRTLPFDVFAPLRRLEPVVTEFADAFSRRRARRATRHRGTVRLLLEALAVLGVVTGAAIAVYLWQVNPVSSDWRLEATHIQDLSRARGAQSEVSIAVAPEKPELLFAASNDSLRRSIRVYSSADGGRTWSASPGPDLGPDACAKGDPSVAIGPDRREYAAFTVNAFCTQFDPAPYLVVASRVAPGKPWTVRRVARKRFEDSFDDKPSIAAGPDGHVHVAWSKLVVWTRQTTVISSSADGGRSWSRPRIVSRDLVQPQLVHVTVSPRGTLYLTGVDAGLGVWVARSDDARTFVVRRVGPLPSSRASSCLLVGSHPIAEQANHCLGPNPTVAATRTRTYVTYGTPFEAPAKDVSIAVFDAALEPLGKERMGNVGGADRFWPVSAVDARTGLLWTCFYDTSGDPSRKQAWFSCATSRDGHHWTTPVRAAAASASPQVLWEDSRIYGFGDQIGYGGYPGLAVADGVAHPAWIDTQDTEGDGEEVFAARVPANALEP